MARLSQDPPLDILLVGRELPGNANLGLGYLLAAARAAGLHAELRVLNGWRGIGPLAQAIVAAAPRLVGLAMPDGASAVLPITLGELLTELGYRGHITAGGPFATLARRWLLGRHGWLDSVVRYAGEAPLVALSHALAAGRSLAEVGGVSTRAGDGLPAPVLDRAALELEPARDTLPRLLGRPMAQLTATRGCLGRCAYCGPASLQCGELDEGRRAGIAQAQLHAAGVGGVRRRSIEQLADEMAALWHQRGVRYFYFVDEHLLPHRQDEALAWLAAWRQALARRRVGPFGVGCMLRGDRLSAPMIDAFVDLGLVRCFVGLELGSRDELRRFGRGGRSGRALRALRALERRGVALSCNLMLVHPDATTSSIASGIELLGSLGAVAFEAAQMHVYHGTALHQRLAAEGRLLGSPLQYGYRFVDPAAERFAELLNRLRLEALGDYSLACRAHDAAVALALGARLHPKMDCGAERAALQAASRRSNALRCALYRSALELAQRAADEARWTAFVAQARSHARPVGAALARIERSVIERFGRAPQRFAPLEAAAIPLLTVCLATAASACQPSAPAQPEPGLPAPTVQVEPAPAASTAGATPAETTTQVTGAATASQPAPPPVCTEAEAQARDKKVQRLLAKADRCSYAQVRFGSGPTRGRYRSPKITAALEAGLEARERACLDEQARTVTVPGHSAEEQQRFRGAVEPCAQGHSDHLLDQVRIDIGPTGKVVAVRAHTGVLPPALRRCITRAVAGLRFPCFAGTTRRPYPRQMVIME